MSIRAESLPLGGRLEPARPQVPAAADPRAYPRVPLEVPVAFRNGSGQHCAARLHNLSPGGLQVRCNIATARIIHPAGGYMLESNRPLLQATAVLPLASGPASLSLAVRLLYALVAGEHAYCVLGFQFLDPRPKAQRIIDTFFAEQLRYLNTAASAGCAA
jgi:hypothetical protein